MNARRALAICAVVALVLLAGVQAIAGATGPPEAASSAQRAKGCGADDEPVAGSGYLAGGGGPDQISGGAGPDRIDGFGGTDCLSGAADIDVLFGGKNKDRLDGGSGLDFLYGGAAADRLIATDGEVDFLYGGAANDVIQADTIDWCYGQGGDDQITGCAGRIVN